MLKLIHSRYYIVSITLNSSLWICSFRVNHIINSIEEYWIINYGHVMIVKDPENFGNGRNSPHLFGYNKVRTPPEAIQPYQKTIEYKYCNTEYLTLFAWPRAFCKLTPWVTRRLDKCALNLQYSLSRDIPANIPKNTQGVFQHHSIPLYRLLYQHCDEFQPLTTQRLTEEHV